MRIYIYISPLISHLKYLPIHKRTQYSHPKTKIKKTKKINKKIKKQEPTTQVTRTHSFPLLKRLTFSDIKKNLIIQRCCGW